MRVRSSGRHRGFTIIIGHRSPPCGTVDGNGWLHAEEGTDMAQSERDRNEWGAAEAEMEGGSTNGGEPAGGRTASPDEEIRRRAYELYESRGGGPGSEMDDWLAAERELRSRPEEGGDAAADPSRETGTRRRGGSTRRGRTGP